MIYCNALCKRDSFFSSFGLLTSWALFIRIGNYLPFPSRLAVLNNRTTCLISISAYIKTSLSINVHNAGYTKKIAWVNLRSRMMFHCIPAITLLMHDLSYEHALSRSNKNVFQSTFYNLALFAAPEDLDDSTIPTDISLFLCANHRKYLRKNCLRQIFLIFIIPLSCTCSFFSYFPFLSIETLIHKWKKFFNDAQTITLVENIQEMK